MLDPFDSVLLIRGIKTLAVRMDRHTENALYLARFLKERSEVAAVYYPGLETDVNYEVQSRQAKNGGAIVSFVLGDDKDPARFFEAAKGGVIALAESLGGVESLVCHPSSMTHASIPEAIRNAVGISENLVRFSVGIENVKDIQAHIVKMLERA